MNRPLVTSLTLIAAIALAGCNPQNGRPTAASGVTQAQVKVPTGPDGKTTEQQNIAERLIRDNKPGSIKHLYVISAMTGTVLIYSTVRGKVTSSGKRLSPLSGYGLNGEPAFRIQNRNTRYYTSETIQDDGTYGSSVPYVYWFDAKGVYHQHYITGGQIFHVSDAPLAVAPAVIDMTLSGN